MKIRTQLIISMVFFAVALAIISASVISTNQQVERLNKQEALAKNIELEVGELSYLSNDYLLYHETQQIDRWESKYSSFLIDASNLTFEQSDQQVLVNNIKANGQRLKDIFGDVVSRIKGEPPLQQSTISPAFIQVSWSRMGVQTQGIVFDASRLAQMLHDQADQMQQKNNMLIFSLMGAFIALLLANYLIFYRGTLRSIEFLQTGTRIIGSGNLDFSLEEKRNDEVGELSRAFNLMTANLKTVTASKADLEREIVERKQAVKEIESLAKFPEENPSPVMRIAANGAIIYANQASDPLLRAWGCQVGEMLPDDYRNLVLEAYGSGYRNEINAIFSSMAYSIVFVPFVEMGYVNVYGRDITQEKNANRALKEIEQRFRDAIDNFPNVFVIYDADRRVTYVNSNGLQIMGLSEQDVIGRKDEEIFPPEMINSYLPALKLAVETKTPQTLERTRSARLGGQTIVANIVPLLDESGKIRQILGITYDITERKHQEEQITKITRLYSVLSSVNEVIVRVSDEELLCSEICRIVAEVGGYPLVWIGQVKGEQVMPVAWSGPASDYLKNLRVGLKGELGKGPTGTSIRENRSIINDDFAANPATQLWREPAINYGFRSSAAFPLHRRGLVVGAFSLYASEPKAFDSEQVGLLESLCADISYALDSLEKEQLRVLAEEGLRETRDYLENLIDYANAPIIVWDPSFRITRFNHAFERLTGLRAAEALGEGLYILFPEESRDTSIEYINRTSSGERWDVVEIPIKNIDGSVRTVLWNSANIYDKNGTTAVATIAQGQDITERKQAEEGLEAINDILKIANNNVDLVPLLNGAVDYLKNFSHCTAVGIRLLDEEGNIPYQAYEGFSQSFYEQESPLSIKSDQCMCINVVKGEVDPELPFYTEGGSFYMNGTTRFLATVSEEDKGQTRNVCNQVGYESVALVPIRFEKSILGLVQLSDYRENMVPLDMVEVMEKIAMQLGTAIVRVKAQQGLKESEAELRMARDELEQRVLERTAELSKASMELEARAAELSKKTDDLTRSNSELEQFAYVASHDLQEPLRMISSYVQLLSRRYEGKLDKDADDFIAYAVEGTKRMQQLINDLLAYSRVGTRGKPPEPTDFEDVLSLATANLKIAAEEAGAVVTHDQLPVANADKLQMVQLFQNLIGNAIKFRGKDAPQVHVSARPDGEFWVFSVKDNGIGIDPQFYDRIFTIFQRLHGRDKYPGTGIGLAVAKKIVERHGGRIWLESSPGKGTTFYFTVLMQAEQAEVEETNYAKTE